MAPLQHDEFRARVDEVCRRTVLSLILKVLPVSLVVGDMYIQHTSQRGSDVVAIVETSAPAESLDSCSEDTGPRQRSPQVGSLQVTHHGVAQETTRSIQTDSGP